MSFEKNLESLRKQKGWSQDDLADRLNLTRQAVSKWETGSSKPDIDNVKNISQLFSVKIDDLLNNEVVEDKAVSLNFEKKEKRENIIKTIKFAIIALVIVYLITVIYKFASLLIIVNGVQKYANLNNYHYVITTYDENGLKEKEECWFKDGVSKTVNTIFEEGIIKDKSNTCINYNLEYGYIENLLNSEKMNIDYNNYIIFHQGYDQGKQLWSNFPSILKQLSIKDLFLEAINFKAIYIKEENDKISLSMQENVIMLDDNTLLPICSYTLLDESNDINYYYFNVELNCIDNVKI